MRNTKLTRGYLILIYKTYIFFRGGVCSVLNFINKMRQPKTLYIHGLQRSGTNWLIFALKSYKVLLSNQHDEQPKSLFNKHFRWRSQCVPLAVLSPYFFIFAKSRISKIEFLDEWDENFDPNSKHIVIFKPIDEWLQSIFRWGHVNAWYKNKEDFESNVGYFIEDYNLYIRHWIHLKSISKGRVVIVDYNDLNKYGFSKLSSFLVPHQRRSETVNFYLTPKTSKLRGSKKRSIYSEESMIEIDGKYLKKCNDIDILLNNNKEILK